MSGTNLSLMTSDGVTIRYDDEGEGRPVVFASGFADQGSSWVFQRDALVEAGYRVIRFDHRMHGRSDAPAHGQRMSRLGLDLGELIAALDVHDVVLVGHSMGVSVSLAYFSIAGCVWDRITTFVAIDQSPKIVNEGDWQWGVRDITGENLYDAADFRFDWSNADREPPAPDHVKPLRPSGDDWWKEFPVARFVLCCSTTLSQTGVTFCPAFPSPRGSSPAVTRHTTSSTVCAGSPTPSGTGTSASSNTVDTNHI